MSCQSVCMCVFVCVCAELVSWTKLGISHVVQLVNYSHFFHFFPFSCIMYKPAIDRQRSRFPENYYDYNRSAPFNVSPSMAHISFIRCDKVLHSVNNDIFCRHRRQNYEIRNFICAILLVWLGFGILLSSISLNNTIFATLLISQQRQYFILLIIEPCIWFIDTQSPLKLDVMEILTKFLADSFNVR